MNTWLTDADGNRCPTEKWLPVKSFPAAYAVSNTGKVRSIDRKNINRNGVTRFLRGKLLKLSSDSEGYLQISLLRDGSEKKVRVHRLVAETFILNPNQLPLVDHIDGNRSNNAVSNLRWASFSQNRKNCRFYDSNADALADMKRLAEGATSP